MNLEKRVERIERELKGLKKAANTGAARKITFHSARFKLAVAVKS